MGYFEDCGYLKEGEGYVGLRLQGVGVVWFIEVDGQLLGCYRDEVVVGFQIGNIDWEGEQFVGEQCFLYLILFLCFQLFKRQLYFYGMIRGREEGLFFCYRKF